VDLVGAAEIADMLGGVSRQRVYVITTRSDFPAPVGVLRGGRVWDEAQVRAWIAAHRPFDSDEPG
jgi:predicted DNA-binding transcriptional regulator AlpA